jgi:Holliday junction resolvase YEN1
MERNILYNILHLRFLGIRLHFVFDGRHQSAKKGAMWRDLGDVPIELLQQTLTHIGIPWHEAPGKAEAECAAMQMRGIVDAVWSEDGREFAYGCQVLIRFKIDTKDGKPTKSHTHFYLHRLAEISNRIPGLSREGFVLHAVLSGADDEKARLDIDPVIAIKAAEQRLGTKLCIATELELPEWRKDFIQFLRDFKSNILVPNDFPKYENVRDNNWPPTSDESTLEKYQSQWEPPISEEALKDFLIHNFNFRVEDYIKWIVPMLLVRSLVQTVKGHEGENSRFGVVWVKDPKTSPKKPIKNVKRSERQEATFLLSAATSLDMSKFPRKNDNGPFDTNYRAHVKTLRLILQNSKRNAATMLRDLAAKTTPPETTSADTSFSESVVANSSPPSRLENKRKRTPEKQPIPTNSEGIKSHFHTSKRQRINSKAPTPDSFQPSKPKETNKEDSSDINAQSSEKAPMRESSPPSTPKNHLGSSSHPIDLDSSQSSHYDSDGYDDLPVTPLLQSSPMSSPPLMLENHSKGKKHHENLYDSESTQSDSEDIHEAPLSGATPKPPSSLLKNNWPSSAVETNAKAPDDVIDANSRESSHYDSEELPVDELLKLP